MRSSAFWKDYVEKAGTAGSDHVVGTRSCAIRGRTSAGHVRCSASDGRCTPARPASHVWKRICGRATPDAPERAYDQRRCTGC